MASLPRLPYAVTTLGTAAPIVGVLVDGTSAYTCAVVAEAGGVRWLMCDVDLSS